VNILAPGGALAGDVKNFQMDWRGTLDTPQSWNGRSVAQVDNVRQSGLAFDRVTLTSRRRRHGDRCGGADRYWNKSLQVRGTVQLPATIKAFAALRAICV
jgi:hypothetical protein